ncbi:unnamed protein product [Ectocarpus sp. CCAP 1310/34]|nr:unnamed protein product [Ectocarpus sp. CCAP 1310/34]
MLPPSVDAFEGKPGLLGRATTLLVGAPTALRDMSKDIDATFLLEKGVTVGQEPASGLREAAFVGTIQPSKEWVFEAIDERSPVPLCEEPGACVVATLSSMTPVDLTQMVERAFLAEANIVRQVFQLHRIVRECEAEQDSMVNVADDKKHFGFWGLMVLVQKAGWRSWNYSVPAAMPFRLTDHVPSSVKVTELLFFAHQRASSFPMASWPRFCSMTALCVAFASSGCCSPSAGMESQLEEERAKWQREAEIATAAAVATCQTKVQLFFQSQPQEERRKAKLSMKKAVEDSKKEALLAFGQMVRENREAKDGKWQKKLDGVEDRLLGRVKDELGDTPATIASVRADVLQLTKQAACMHAAMEKAVMDEILRSGTEQLEMGQAKLREEMARFQQETEEAMGNLTAKLYNVKENTDALGSGLLTVQNIVMKTNGRRIKKVLYRMEERAEESSRVWGEGPKLGPHFAHWKATKKQLKEDGGGDDDEGEEHAGGNLSGPPQEEGEQKEQAGGNLSRPPQGAGEQKEEAGGKPSGPPQEDGERKEGEEEDKR